MRKLINRHSRKAGLPPGSLVYVGEPPSSEPAVITVIDFSEAELHERAATRAAECRSCIDSSTVSWINVNGLHDIELMREFGEVFGLHPLVLEDMLNMGQRPKMEYHPDYALIVLKMLRQHPESQETLVEQVSLILGRHYVLTFQEREGDVFDTIRGRLRGGQGRIRQMGSDYLAYALVDAIVDGYFVVLESLGDRVEALQDRALEQATPETLQELHALKRDLVIMRKGLWPLRELVSRFGETETELINDGLAPYLKDVYEHTIQVIENVEMLRDLLTSTLDIYMTTVSNRMNETMKVLTVIATIFIPLTFIAGVYGMNFEHMPELKWPWAYGGVWLVMIGTAVGMVAFFRRRRWM